MSIDALPRRSFGILDAMVLLGAMAVGMVGVREVWLSYGFVDYDTPKAGWTLGAILAHVPRAILLLFPLLFALTPAVLVLRLRKPRPALTQLALQPGAAACGAMTMVITLGIFRYLCEAVLAGINFGFRSGYWTDFTSGSLWFSFNRRVEWSSPELVACPVLVAWSFLAVAKLGCPEKSWIDRTGRAIGVLWLVTSLCLVLEHWLPIVASSWFPDRGERGF
jgi:hypothetical protein